MVLYLTSFNTGNFLSHKNSFARATPEAWFTIRRIALRCDAMRHRAALATIYEHEIASAMRRIASCRAVSRG